MSELDNRVEITVNIADASLSRPGFGIGAIVHKHQQASLLRVQSYSSLTASRVDFPSYTPVGVFMTLFFGQGSTIGGAIPEIVKVIKQESAETITAALDAALLVDSDFYGVVTPDKTPAVIQAGAAWALANNRFFGYSTAEADAITTATTDSFSVIKALSNSRAAGWYTNKAGGEFVIDSITVAGTTATMDLTTHGSVPMAVGETIGVWTSAVPALNSTWIVDTIGVLECTFTVPTGTTSDAASSDGWFNYNLLEAAAFGKMLPQDAGAKTWDIQNLAGVTADNIDTTAQINLGGKNGNWFSDLAGISITSGLKSNGGGGKTASGRYIDIQRGADWLKVNLQLDLATLLINEAGSLGFDANDFQKVQTTMELRMDEGIDNNFLTPFVTGQFAGQPYNVAMPELGSIVQADKINRLLTGIVADALIKGSIHNVEATLNLST